MTPISDAEFVTRIFLGAVFCSVACLVISVVVLWWVGRTVVWVGKLENRIAELEDGR